jgi:acyl carrier protein
MTMTTDEAKRTIVVVLEGIAPEVDPGSVEHDVDLDVQLDLDSMDYLNWLIGISKATGVEIPQRDATRFLTIDGAAAYLVEHGA